MKKKITLYYIIIGLLSSLVIVFSILVVQVFRYKSTDSNSSDIVTSSQAKTSESIPKETVIVAPNKSSSSASSNITSSIQKPVEPSSNNVSYESIDTAVQIQEEDKSAWFKQAYSLAESRYKSELKTKKIPLESQKNELYSQREDYATEKLYAQQRLMEQYANMGLLNSGQYTSALNNLNNSYNSKISALDNQISALNSNIKEIDAEINNPDPNQILAIIAVNNNLTSSQVIEYYNKYMN